MAINIERGLPYEAILDSFKWFVGQADDCVYPDGDWPPLLLMETAEVVKVAPLWHYDWSTEEAKDFIAHHVLPSMVRHEQARRVGLALHMQGVADEGGPKPSDEGIALFVIDREHCETWWAPVKRRPKEHPTLGAWEYCEGVKGRFVEPLRRAVCPQG